MPQRGCDVIHRHAAQANFIGIILRSMFSTGKMVGVPS